MFLFLIEIFFQNFKVTFGTIEELFTGYSDKSNLIAPFDPNICTLIRVGK